jgi:glycosyltransferase involved in cell wall biosynthesis
LLYTIFITIFLLSVVLQSGFAFLFLLPKKKKKNIPAASGNITEGCSIVICARNEEANLSRFLKDVLQQEYPAGLFEVIVVDDASTDGTAHILTSLQQQFPCLKIVTVLPAEARQLPGKKHALSRGIAMARFDRILLTDADCRPRSPFWLQLMAHEANHARSLVLGYGAYEEHRGLLNRFIRWETAHTLMQYISYARAGMAYMGVGRNMLYHKTLLEELRQDKYFNTTYTQLPSGDDDLVVSGMSATAHVNECLLPGAHTISAAPQTWFAWWRQKTRHVSTGKFYRQKTKFFLGLYAISHSLYWVLAGLLLAWILACPVHKYQVFAFILLFSLRLILSWITAAVWYRRVGEKKLLLFYPLGDLGWALYNVLLSPYILWKNRQAWK